MATARRDDRLACARINWDTALAELRTLPKFMTMRASQRALAFVYIIERLNLETAEEMLRARRPVVPGEGRVYFARAGRRGAIKIGYSIDTARRLKELQKPLASRVSLLCELPGTRDHEALLHDVFSRHRLRSEWFHPHPDILEFARRARGGEEAA